MRVGDQEVRGVYRKDFDFHNVNSNVNKGRKDGKEVM
jgi:hypothetical protein